MALNQTPRQTRRKLLLDKEELTLTNEEGEYYIKIHEEFRKIEQKIKNNEVIEITTLKSTVLKAFDQASTRNNDFDKLNQSYQTIFEKLKEVQDERNHLERTLKKYKEVNENLISDHELILEDLKRIINEKDLELKKLKHDLKQQKEKSLETEILESSIINDSTSFENTYKTPNNKKPKQDVVNITPYTPISTSPHDSTFNLTVVPSTIQPVHNIEFEQKIETRMKHIEDNVKTIIDKLKKMNTVRANKTIDNPSDKILPTKPSNSSSETQQKSVTKESKPINNIKPTVQREFDICLLGDFHLKNFKNILSKIIPKECSIYESVSENNTVPEICKTDNLPNCSHLIFMAGTNDIQKTPMKDIKKSIDELFQKFKSCETIHFIQIPFRYDDIKYNYHIEQVNTSLDKYVHKYENVIIYKTKNIVENWDYTDKTTLNQNGIWKICQQLRMNLHPRSDSRRPRPVTRAQEYRHPNSRNNFHPVFRQSRNPSVRVRTNHRMTLRPPFTEQYKRYQTYPDSTYRRYDHNYDYDTLFPPIRPSNNFRH